jgi:DNA sulfur modification protein DndB
MDAAFEYRFPAIRGIQSNREYYISMCPLRLIPKLFIFDEAELRPELRAQRTLNKARVPEIAEYIVKNRDSYTFSAITASVDGGIHFEPMSQDAAMTRLGLLRVEMNARFIINDGQHRRAAIENALKADPSLGDESIAVVFFHDRGLARSQQMFADLNMHAARPSRSLGLLYEQRDDLALITKEAIPRTKIFRDMVEFERSTLAERSRKLFTLSAIYGANKVLTENRPFENRTDVLQFLVEFWDTVGTHMKEWQLIQQGRQTSGELRRDFIHAHSIALHALGIVGRDLVQQFPKSWKGKLRKLREIDWSRSNTKDWEGRAMLAGAIAKTNSSQLLTANYIQKKLGVELTRIVKDAKGASK